MEDNSENQRKNFLFCGIIIIRLRENIIVKISN